MRIKRLKINNFRSIRNLELELGPTTVFIGPNNAGKTAILDAVRIVLTRRWGQKGTGFTEYDIHLADENADPKTCGPVLIELELQEEQPGDWSADLQAELQDIIQLDPVTGAASIILRVSCAWDAAAGSYAPRWEFLNVARAPLAGRAARAVNLQEFFQFVPVFYLEALRDAGDQFSERSQFWGRLLRTVQIPESLERRAKRVFDLLNAKVLGADARLGALAGTISNMSHVASGDQPGAADLRVMPLRPWDLLSRAEVIYRAEGDKPWLPLAKHGQGIQSLSVLFLFRAFIEQLLPELYKPDSAPVLALEEPETHLHPQAARAVWRHVDTLPGQKLVTTHSPYFLQHVPFRDLRIVRLGPTGSTVASLPAVFRAVVPHTPELAAVLANAGGHVQYDGSLGELVVRGALSQDTFRALLVAFAQHQDRALIHTTLRRVYDESQLFVSDAELEQLDTFARRVRGEIFFARRWFLVEGQCEYKLAHGIARGLGYDLDEHGVSVIDFQNNGNPEIFVALARALRIPWLLVADGDLEGQNFLTRIENRGVPQVEIAERCQRLPAGKLEQQLVADGLQAELRQILIQLGHADADALNDADLADRLESTKTAYASLLSRRCATDAALAQRLLAPIRQAVATFRGIQ